MRHYLLVDDNVPLAENLAEILDDAGARVTIVSSGAAALDQVRQTRFDAMLTDMRMPIMGGAALMHEIRRVDPGLPALVLTAYTGEGDLSDARSEGLLAVFPKPVPISELIAVLTVARRDGLVAVFEDDEALCDNLSEALRMHGFTAMTAHRAAETSRIEHLRPFAAIVDLRLDGDAVGAAMITLAQQHPTVPILVVTGFPEAMPDVTHEALFAKPFDTQRLLASLEAVHARGKAP